MFRAFWRLGLLAFISICGRAFAVLALDTAVSLELKPELRSMTNETPNVASRPCNTGNKPEVDCQKFGKLLCNYIDTVTDAEVFELRTYSGKKSSSGVDYAALASLHLLIKTMLQVTPKGYLKKQMCFQHLIGHWLSDHCVAYSQVCQRKN